MKSHSRTLLATAVTAALLAGGLALTVSTEPAAAVFERAKETQGRLGKVIVNPYKVSPLTAIIERDGLRPKNVTVTVQGKAGGGVDIRYPVSEAAVLHHDGVPVFGLYDGHVNSVLLEYTLDGQPVKETYRIRTNAFQGRITEGKFEVKPKVESRKVTKGFEDRLYILTLMGNADAKEWAWATPQHKTHGAGEWLEPAEFYALDSQGEIRWYFDTKAFYDKYGRSIDDLGRIMSFYQLKNGDILFGQAQKYFRYSLMGEPAFARKLPRGYIDQSHEILPMDNGHTLLRVAKANYRIPGTKDVANTVRDHIIEVDEGGRVVDEWDLVAIMGKDQYRKDLIVALDEKAVCLNVDMNAEKIQVNESVPYGDNASTGAGRNWAHVNSISYDKADDSIILSLRHQGIVKVGRDKKVKWILASPVGWSKEMSARVLRPVDAEGKPVRCENSKCEGRFDWTWTQHTAWLSGRGQNSGNIRTLSVFDNGDGRGMEQPALPKEKYSRAVEYRIDEKAMTVRQTWEYGRERGWDYYSPVTSNVSWQPEKGTYSVMSGNGRLLSKDRTLAYITEVDPRSNEVKYELVISTDKKPGVFYRGHPILQDRLFAY